VALFAAIGTLMLVALLVAGGLASVALAQGSASVQDAAAMLLVTADDALADVVVNWSAEPLDTLSVGATVALTRRYTPVTMHAAVSVTALPRGVYWLVADAWASGDARIHRRVNLIVARPLSGDGLVSSAAPLPMDSRAWMQLFQAP
jgi:hypothetical protein